MMRNPTAAPAPMLALAHLDASVATAVMPQLKARQNAALCRFLIQAGAVQEADLPGGETDPLKACEHAIAASIRRQIGPLHCLQPRFAATVVDAHGLPPSVRKGQQTPYASLELCWGEYHGQEWPVGERLQELNAAVAGLGTAVLQVLCEQSQHAYPLFTPELATDLVSCLYWHGEESEEDALDMLCDGTTGPRRQAMREEMREEMVTLAMVDDAWPQWARPQKGARRRRDGKLRRPCCLRRAIKTLTDPRMRQIAADALALSRLPLDGAFLPEVEGEYTGFGAILSWRRGDVTTRIYGDLLDFAQHSAFCDHMGQAQIALDDPAALAACLQRMAAWFKAIALIDRLIYALCPRH